jgi:WD40 repeat protein
MSKTRSSSRQAPLERILGTLARGSATAVASTAAVLAVLSVFPATQLPPELAGLIGGIGVNILSSLIERISRGENVSDTEIRAELQKASALIEKNLKKEEFDNAFSLLLTKYNKLHKEHQLIVTRLEAINKALEPIADIKNELRTARRSRENDRPLNFFVPYPHNPDFVGRQEELETLHQLIHQSTSPVGIRPTVLVGLGGIGKTQLAVEYAHAHKDDYPDGVFWINAVNPFQLEFASLSEMLGLVNADTPAEQAVYRSWSYLDSHPNALVIFDNVVEPSQLNVPFSMGLIPANLHCRTLFTTRQRDFPGNFQPFELKVLPEAAALKLLLRSRSSLLDDRGADWVSARIICASLGRLPLALELAAAYLGEYQEVSLPDYLERLQVEGKLNTVDDTHLSSEELPTRHEIAVSATLQTQWSRLLDEEARVLFRAAGQLPEGAWIPVSRLGILTGITGVQKPGHPSPLLRAIKKLRAVSLIEELSADRLRLHPLVQEFASGLSPQSFPGELAARVYQAYGDLSFLNNRILENNARDVLGDIRTGITLASRETADPGIGEPLAGLEYALGRVVHQLRNVNAGAQPNFFVQQFRTCCFEAGFDELCRQADIFLNDLKQPYLRELFRPAEENKSAGHTGAVNSVSMTPDDRYIVSASEDSTIKIWESGSGKMVRTLEGHSASVECAVVSPDGDWIVSGSKDTTIRVWDLATGQAIRMFEGHTEPVNSVAITPDGQFILSASDDSKVIVWEIVTGQIFQTLEGHQGTVYGVTITPDGHSVITAGEDETVRIWDFTTGKPTHVLKGHADVVNCVSVSAGGDKIVSASDDGNLIVWGGAGRDEQKVLRGHTKWVIGVALSPDGQRVVSASRDNNINVWDLNSGQLLNTLTGHTNAVIGVTVTHDNRHIVSCSEDGSIKIWELATGLNLRTLEGHTKHLFDISIAPDGRRAITCSDDDVLEWSLSTGEIAHCLVANSIKVYGVDITPDGRVAVSVDDDGIIRIWDMATHKIIRAMKGEVSLKDVALTPDGRFAVACADDGALQIWELSTGKMVRRIRGHADWINAVAITADGRSVLSASEDCSIKVWDMAAGECTHVLTGHKYPVYDVKTTPDCLYAVSGSDDRTLRLWDLKTGKTIRILKGHTGQVNALAITPDGNHVISVTLDNYLKIWELSSGKNILTFAARTSLYCCSITPDGRTILVGDGSGRLLFLEWVKKPD